MRHALPMAGRIAALKRQAKEAGIPAIYVNDNFGRWQSNFRAQVEHCLEDGVTGRPIAQASLLPSMCTRGGSGYFSTTPLVPCSRILRL